MPTFAGSPALWGKGQNQKKQHSGQRKIEYIAQDYPFPAQISDEKKGKNQDTAFGEKTGCQDKDYAEKTECPLPCGPGTHPPLGRRIAAYQNVKHQDAQCQREKDIVGQVKPPGRADRIIESVAQRHDPGPNKQARHIPD